MYGLVRKVPKRESKTFKGGNKTPFNEIKVGDTANDLMNAQSVY